MFKPIVKSASLESKLSLVRFQMESKKDLIQSNDNVNYKRTDVLSLWHQQKSTTVDIRGPLQTRGDKNSYTNRKFENQWTTQKRHK